MTRNTQAILVLATLASVPAAAHELLCEATVDHAPTVEITGYPAQVTLELTVTNVHPDQASDVLGADDLLLACDPRAQFPVPFTLPLAGSENRTITLDLPDYHACRMLAERDGVADDFIDDVFTVTWDVGRRQCRTRILCLAPMVPRGPTRPAGWWQNQPGALAQCLATGPLDLGFLQLSTVPEALGLFWGAVGTFPGGAARLPLERSRFLLARQLVAGRCNTRLFGTTPPDEHFVPDAVAAECTGFTGLDAWHESRLTAFNASGEALSLPGSFDPGPPDPAGAQLQSQDPTRPGQACSP